MSIKDIIQSLEASINIAEKELEKMKKNLDELKRIDSRNIKVVNATVKDLNEKWLTSAEAAEEYSKSPDTFRKSISYGNLVEGVDCKKVGKSWLFLKSSLDKLYK